MWDRPASPSLQAPRLQALETGSLSSIEEKESLQSGLGLFLAPHSMLILLDCDQHVMIFSRTIFLTFHL